jgi:8-oxo-dGTP diphosphatase
MTNFSIRVYGILTHPTQGVLVSDEWIRGMKITKFPGGGLELGEGTRDCLVREFMEEMNLRVAVGAHLYTTDFFQQSAFNSNYQILSIYYWVTALEPLAVRVSRQPFDFDAEQLARYAQTQEVETFRWVPWIQFDANSVHLPIDKVAAALVRASQ